MSKKWFEIKEQAAGTKRLLFMWHIYRFLGKNAVNAIAFLVALFVFIVSKPIRDYSKTNVAVIAEFCDSDTQKILKPNNLNAFKNILNYALSLVDNMEIFAGRFDLNKINFNSQADEENFYEDIKKRKGIFFICSHTGNIQVLRMFFKNKNPQMRSDVNILLSQEQCKIFNSFLKKVQNSSKIVIENNVSLFPVEDISVETSIQLKERLDKGEIAFMAGDRLSSGTANITFVEKFFGHDVEFPSGTFKLAQLMETPVYFICALKEKQDSYRIFLKRFEINTLSESKKAVLKKMQKEYVEFVQKITILDPLQFYHFYQIFDK